MTDSDREKEVDYYTYCQLCKYHGCLENEDPCWDCLAEPTNINSHKPVEFKPASNTRTITKE